MALTKVTQHSLGNSAVTTAKINLTTPLGIANNTSNTLYIQSNGRIGVGTTDLDSFGRKFLVSGTGGFDNASGTVGIGFSRGASNTYGYLGTGDWAVNGLSNTDFGISSGAAGALAFGTASGNEKMRITNAGNVGINNAAPTHTLSVNGPSFFGGSTFGIAGLGTKVYSGAFTFTNSASNKTITLSGLTYADLSAYGPFMFIISGALLNDAYYYSQIFAQYRPDYVGLSQANAIQVAQRNSSTAGQSLTFTINQPGLNAGGTTVALTAAYSGPDVGAGGYTHYLKVFVYRMDNGAY